MPYKVHCKVFEGNTPVERTVRIYNRENGFFIGKTTTVNGECVISGLKNNNELNLICLDDDTGVYYEDQIIRIIPEIDDSGTISTIPSNIISLDGIVLPEVLMWTDEFSWSPVKQDIKYSTTGAIFIQEHLKIGGRPITLKNEDYVAYIDQSTATSLFNKQQQAGLVMDLTINSTTMEVIFRQNDYPLQITKLTDDSDEVFIIEYLKLMQVFTG